MNLKYQLNFIYFFIDKHFFIYLPCFYSSNLVYLDSFFLNSIDKLEIKNRILNRAKTVNKTPLFFKKKVDFFLFQNPMHLTSQL
jgi:hypothetical protein